MDLFVTDHISVYYQVHWPGFGKGDKVSGENKPFTRWIKVFINFIF